MRRTTRSSSLILSAICVIALVPPISADPIPPDRKVANDTCAGAIDIPTPGHGTIEGTTESSADDYDPWYPSCTSMPAPGLDVVFRFDLEPDDIVSVIYTQTGADGSVYLVSDCEDVAASCVAGADQTGFGQAEHLVYVVGTPVPGACCYPDESCLFIPEDACADGGGIWRGAWWDCEPNFCYLLRGACCLPDDCVDYLSPWECAAIGGDYAGDGTMCYWGVCPRPPGACCFESGECLVVDGQACFSQQGYFLGEGSTCDPNPCLEAFGACCDIEHVCRIVHPLDCVDAGGEYQGDYVRCEETTCGEPVGPCCFADGTCRIMTASLCDLYGGIWLGWNEPCDPNPCPASRPDQSRTDARVHYLILDSRANDAGGPWRLEYRISRPGGLPEDEAAGEGSSGLLARPNPFALQTTIVGPRGVTGSVRLEVFSAAGRLVRRIQRERGDLDAGVRWDGLDDRGVRIPAGVYFIRVIGPNLAATLPVIRLE